MAFDTRLLGPDEQLLLDLRPHWSQLARSVSTVALVLALGIGAVAGDGPRLAQYVIAGCLVASVAVLILRYLQWRRINFALTSQRLIYRTGLGARRGLEIPLDRIGMIQFDQSLPERLLQRGDLSIEALGDNGVQVFRNVPRPKHVQRDIYAAIEAHQHALLMAHKRAEQVATDPAATAVAAGTPYSIPQQIDQLDQLRRRGVISDREFHEKKRELLDRM